MSVEIDINNFDNVLIENEIPFLTKFILQYFGIYNNLFNRKNNCFYNSLKFIWTVIIELYLSSMIVIILNSSNSLVRSFISLIIPMMLMIFYLLIIYFPKWSKSKELIFLLTKKEYLILFNKRLKQITFCFLLIYLPLNILMYINFDDIEWINYKRTDFFPLIIQIFAFPFMFTFFSSINLLISFQIISSKYTCNQIKDYLNDLEKLLMIRTSYKINNGKNISEISDKQNKLEKWCYNLNKLTSLCNGLLLLFFMFLGVMSIEKGFIIINISRTEAYIDVFSGFFYFIIVLLILYNLSSWNSTYKKFTHKWKNKADIIPSIINNFGTIDSFNLWLENHESHASRLFGPTDGLRVNKNFYNKIFTLFGSLFTFVIGYLNNLN